MVVYLLLTIVTIALSYFVGRKNKIVDYVALTGIFLLLSLASVLRVNIGNDYGRYTVIFHELSVDGYVITEKLFNKVVASIMKNPFWGDYCYFVVFGVFAVATIALFLKAIYDYSEDFFLSFFLFMTLGYYFQTYSIMRYYLALAIALYAIRFIQRKQYVLFLLMTFLAAGFHKAALAIIPMYLLASLPWTKWKCRYVLMIVYALASIQLLVFQEFYMKVMLRIYPSYLEEQELLRTEISKPGIARCVLVLLLCLLCYRTKIVKDDYCRFFFTCNLFALTLYTFGHYIPVVSRIVYFINIGQIFLIPACIKEISLEKFRKFLYACTLAAGLLFFAVFFKGVARNSLAIVPYQTWVFIELEDVRTPVYTYTGAIE